MMKNKRGETGHGNRIVVAIRMRATLVLLIVDYLSFSFMFKCYLMVFNSLKFCIFNCNS